MLSLRLMERRFIVLSASLIHALTISCCAALCTFSNVEIFSGTALFATEPKIAVKMQITHFDKMNFSQFPAQNIGDVSAA